MNARRLGLSGFVTYLGLNRPPEELGLSDYSYFISPHMNTERIYESGKHLDDPLMQASVCLNNAVPDCSPPGTSILSLTTLFHPEAWKDVAPEEYIRVKNTIAEKMILRFEAATGTGIRGHIEEIEVATPQTFARYTGAISGNIYGWEPEPWDSIVSRAIAEKEEQYIRGLYFAGGFGYRCHGYSGSLFSGRKAARDILSGGGL